jgi:hypothetical protein
VALTVSVFARIAWGYATLLVAPRLVLALLGLLTAGVYVAALYMAPSWPRAGLLAFGCWFGAVAYSWNGIFLAETADRSGGRVAEATAGAVSLAFLGALIVPVLFTGLIAFLDFEAGLMAVAALMLAAAIYAGAALRR